MTYAYDFRTSKTFDSSRVLLESSISMVEKYLGDFSVISQFAIGGNRFFFIANKSIGEIYLEILNILMLYLNILKLEYCNTAHVCTIEAGLRLYF